MQAILPEPHEESVILVAATNKNVYVKAPNDPGLLAVRYDYLAYDQGAIAGPAVIDVGVQVIPQQGQTEIFGGDTRHYFAALPRNTTSTANVLPLGFELKPGQDVRLNFLSAAGGTIRIRLARTKIFARQAA